jgi:hypothetical protein
LEPLSPVQLNQDVLQCKVIETDLSMYTSCREEQKSFRIVGSTLASVLTFLLSSHWQNVRRRQRIEMLRRFETIAWMNDRIRNALQAVECVDYAANSQATDSVRNAVGIIDGVLSEVLSETEIKNSHSEFRQLPRSGPAFEVASRTSD